MIMTTTEAMDTHQFRGATIRNVSAEEITVGTRMVWWLSDATAYATVTGWTDATRDYGTGPEIVRTFETDGHPWWVEAVDLRYALDDIVPTAIAEPVLTAGSPRKWRDGSY